MANTWKVALFSAAMLFGTIFTVALNSTPASAECSGAWCGINGIQHRAPKDWLKHYSKPLRAKEEARQQSRSAAERSTSNCVFMPFYKDGRHVENPIVFVEYGEDASCITQKVECDNCRAWQRGYEGIKVAAAVKKTAGPYSNAYKVRGGTGVMVPANLRGNIAWCPGEGDSAAWTGYYFRHSGFGLFGSWFQQPTRQYAHQPQVQFAWQQPVQQYAWQPQQPVGTYGYQGYQSYQPMNPFVAWQQRWQAHWQQQHQEWRDRWNRVFGR